jgi:SAM-dependent methyltransferase
MIKKLVKSAVTTVVQLPGISYVVQHPSVRQVLEPMKGGQLLYGYGWFRPHPFDVALGIEASGFTPTEDLTVDASISTRGLGYAGSQPTPVRVALTSLPDLHSFSFFDMGCGKGRALIVASEFPFKALVGVEYAPDLAQRGRQNAAICADRFPERVAIKIDLADATTYTFPAGDLVVFLYNPFQAELVEKVVRNIEAAIDSEPSRRVFVVYCNPVSAHCFDASSKLVRRFAKQVPYAASERGFGPTVDETVVIWQGGNLPAPTERADDVVHLNENGTHAYLHYRRYRG